MANRFKEDTMELMEEVGAPDLQQDYNAEEWVPIVVDYWNNKYRGQHKFKVFVFGSLGHYTPIFKYGVNDFDIPIILYYDNKHFDGVKSASGIFGKCYCLSCEKVYDKPSNHTINCKSRCSKCSRVGPNFPCSIIDGFQKLCQLCTKLFYNNNCYQHHLQSGFCKKSKQCEKCGVIWNVKDNTKRGRKGHVCGERHCATCNDFHIPKRGCFIRPLESKDNKKYRIVAFDLETMQHQPSGNGKKHEPNFICAKITCPECILKEEEECKVCGDKRIVTFSHKAFTRTTVDKMVVTPNPLEAFIDWLIDELPQEFDTIAFSHFGGRFDMVLVFKELFLRGYTPEMLKKGNKMYEMKLISRGKNKGSIIFRDSFNLMPMSLAALVPAFALQVEDKPFFPHLANHPENYGKDIFPSPSQYLADGMMPEKRKLFDEWYNQHRHEPFNLEESLASYCTNDVEILMAALIAFRNEFIEVSKREAGQRPASGKAHEGIDVLREAMTIASACMKHFRTNHLKANHVGIVPERGYDNIENQSKMALKFLEWYGEANKVKVQTAISAGGEKRVGNYHLDGWVEDKQLGIEINGCCWHGCSKCYPDDSIVLPNGKTAGKQRELDQQRLNFIKSQIRQLEVYWECEIENMLKKDREMRRKFESYIDNGPVEIRNSFFGGRTGPLRLFYKPKDGERISYFDVTSLYPFINVSTKYPVGHPTVHILNEDVSWTCSTDNKYDLSILKVFVIPPRKIDVPVLPVKLDDRLLFPLCASCARLYPKGKVEENYNCQHNDEQRGWVSTCTSLELNTALDEGYIVTKLFRVLEYTSSDEGLFRSYIAEFMAQKIHSSGFDDSIKGNIEAEDKFIEECKEMFDIKIEREKMVPNKGKRTQAKLCLNNLWGRFSLRNFGLSQCTVTDDPVKVRNLMDDSSKEVTGLDELTPEVVLISHLTKKDWIEEHDCSNVVISLWTTSAARIHLLRAMQQVVRSPGCTLLYTDTDSLIFAHPNESCPLQLGPHLGQFTDEYSRHNILEYCSGGAKQYGLKLQRKDQMNASPEYVLKIRGITLNWDVVVNQGMQPTVKRGSVITQPLKKLYKPFVGKGVLRPSDFTVLDYGFTSN
uniref:DNA-directed DNA polymerase n=1 Tax=Meloidogyne incognita TaxID=6306 RepID=A0A914MV79_MELIC